MRGLLSIFSILFFVSVLHAQDVVSPVAGTAVAAASPAAALVVEAPHTLDKVLELLKSSGGFVAGFLTVMELLFRAFPSRRPLSLLIPAKYFVESFATMLTWLSASLLVPLINVANKSEEKL